MRLGARGAAAPRRKADDYSMMGDEQKRIMCEDILYELGADNITIRGDEIHHSCILPFGLHAHGDRQPSASINWRKLVFNCFGCGSKGTLAWFVASCRGEEVEAVRSWLVSKHQEEEEGVTGFLRYLDQLYGDHTVERQSVIMPQYNPHILDPWKLIHPYLTEERHIPEANLIRHEVGYDPNARRIVLPHYWQATLVGWQTRRLLKDDGPKYKNTPDFPKDRTLYNRPPKSEPVLVVESVLSVVSKSHLSPGLCSTFGASVTDKQLLLLAEHGKVTIWFDNDAAGWKGTYHMGRALAPYCDVFVVQSHWAGDPADLDEQTYWATHENVVPFTWWEPPRTLARV